MSPALNAVATASLVAWAALASLAWTPAALCGEKADVPVTDAEIAGLAEDVRSKRSSDRNRALDNLEFLGERAVPGLAGLARDKDSLARSSAFMILRRLGPRAAGAISAMVEIARSDEHDLNTRLNALSVLRNIGPAAVPSMIALFDDPDEKVRSYAIRYVGEVGPGAARAIPALAVIMAGGDKKFGYAALESLGKIGPEALQHVRAALRSADSGYRRAAVHALGDIGPEAKVALGELVAVNTSSMTKIVALGKIGRGARGALPFVQRCLVDKNASLRTAAARTLWRISPGNKRGLSVLIHALGLEKQYLVAPAAEVLGEMGRAAEPAVDRLTQLLESRDHLIRKRSAVALGMIGGRAVKAAPAIMKLVREDSDEVSEAAVQGLALFGAPGAKLLIEGLSDKKYRTRRFCGEALAKAGDAAKPVIPQLVSALGSRESSTASWAAQALGSIGPDAKEAAPAIVKAILERKKGLAIPWSFPYALRKMEADCDGQLEAFVRALNAGGDWRTREEAARGLLRFGKEAAGAVEALNRMTNDKRLSTRFVAREALETIDPVEVF